MSPETPHRRPSSPQDGGKERSSRPGGSFRGGPGGPGGRGKRPMFRRKACRVCQERTGQVDWKAVNFLRNFVTDRGKIMSARSRGTCAKCQRQLTRAIKRARTMALLPFASV